MKYLKSINEFFFTPEKEYREGNRLSKRIEDFEADVKHIYRDKEEDLSQFDLIIKLIEKDCGPYINELISTKSEILFRGIKTLREYPVTIDEESIGGLWVKKRRSGRYTLDTNPGISEIFDDYFEKKFNIRLRSEGVFATKDPMSASSYSQYNTKLKRRKSYLFFPIGDYDYYWNPKILDLFSDIENDPWYSRYVLDDDALFYKWQNIYGDPRLTWSKGDGNYRLFGYDIPYVPNEKLANWIIENSDKFGLVSNDKGCYTKDGKIIVCNNMNYKNIMSIEWIPSVTFEDYSQNKSEEPYQEVLDIVDGYQKGGLESIKRHEITFDVDRYYVLDEKYYFKFKQWLQSKV